MVQLIILLFKVLRVNLRKQIKLLQKISWLI